MAGIYIVKLFLLLAVIFIIPQDVSAQQEDLSTMSLDEINRRMENPMSDLWSLTLQENLYINTGSLVDGSELSNVLFFQPFMPFPVGNGKMLIVRPVFPFATQPYTSYDNGDPVRKHITGFGDMQLITVYGPDKKSGAVWGIGATFVFPTAGSDILGQGKWQAGPAAIIVYMGRPWVLGLIPQHWTSFAGDDSRLDVNKTDIQYIVRRQIPGGWSIGMGPNITINWEAEEGNRVTFPVGLGMTKTVRWGSVPVKLRIEPQYSIIKPDDYGTEWNIRLQISPVVNSPYW